MNLKFKVKLLFNWRMFTMTMDNSFNYFCSILYYTILVNHFYYFEGAM